MRILARPGSCTRRLAVNRHTLPHANGIGALSAAINAAGRVAEENRVVARLTEARLGLHPKKICGAPQRAKLPACTVARPVGRRDQRPTPSLAQKAFHP